MRNTDNVDKDKEKSKFLKYVWFLLFPLITLVVLHTNPWQKDNSECSPYLKKCTCSAEVPFWLHVIVIFEFLCFLGFVTYDPFDPRNAYDLQYLAVFDALYISPLVLELNAMIQSDVDCSFAIWYVGLLFFAFRSAFIIILNYAQLVFRLEHFCIPKKQTLTVQL